MAVVVNIDQIDGASGQHHVVQGWDINVMATVTGIPEPSGGWTTGLLLSTALAYVIGVTGDRGTPCPNIVVPTYLEKFTPEVETPEVVKIRITYKGYPLPQYEFSSALNQVQSNIDAQGNLITTQYTYPNNYGQALVLPGDPRRAGTSPMQGGFITRPLAEVTFTIKLVVTQGFYAVSQLCLLEGKTNKDPWPIGAIPGAIHTWLVSSVRAVSRDGGSAFELSMSFQYREQTWDPVVVFINPDDGLPPHDLVAGTGYKTVTGPYESTFPTFIFGPN